MPSCTFPEGRVCSLHIGEDPNVQDVRIKFAQEFAHPLDRPGHKDEASRGWFSWGWLVAAGLRPWAQWRLWSPCHRFGCEGGNVAPKKAPPVARPRTGYSRSKSLVGAQLVE